MTQADRDRLVALKKAKKKLITQREAAEELGLSVRHVKRLIYALKKYGDRAVVHGLRGRPSNRKIKESVEQEAVKILLVPVYRGFGPKLAAEYLGKKHGIEASKETVRQWMIAAKLWRAKKERVKQVHIWRPRRSRFGELVQWDTSEHDWLEGRGEKLYLIAMIDDATSRLFARFVQHDSTEENMKLLWSYLENFGRPLTFYTDKASLFRNNEKRRRDEPGVDKDPVEMPPTQIGRALRELGITWIAAHSPQAKGRVERNFGTAQDRLVKGHARGRGEDDRTSQPIPDRGLSGVVGTRVDGGSGESRRCPSAAGEESPFGGFVELCGNAPGAARLHIALGWQVIPDRAPGDYDRIARSQCAGGEAAGRLVSSTLWRTVSASHRMRCAREAETQSCGEDSQDTRRRSRGSDWDQISI